MNKKGSWLTTETIVKAILIGVLIVVIVFGFTATDVLGAIRDFFPSFDKGDIVVNWNEKNFIEYPEEILFFLDDCNPEIYFMYDPKVYLDGGKPRGWVWRAKEVEREGEGLWGAVSRWAGYYTEKEIFISVSNEEHPNFKKLEGINEKNKEFIRDLNGKTPEEGLKVIVTRILENKEDSWVWNAKLNVVIGDVNLVYNPTVAEDIRVLSDLDWLIDRLNQVSRKYLKRIERGDVENE